MILVVLAPGMAASAHGQSGDESLGDLARTLRKSQAPPRTVIDNDNLSSVMEAGEDSRWGRTGLHFSLGQEAVQTVNASNPDVTCALSFSANRLDPLADALKPEKLPEIELAKLDGPAAVVDNHLQISMHNGTGWDIREITVGLTVVRRPVAAPTTDAPYETPARLIPAAVNNPEVPVERQSDVTVLYHLKGTAAPFSTTVFREALNIPLASDQEWHWAIIQAKGIAPAVQSATPTSK